MATEKKGDLEVSILEARNLGIKKGKSLYCSVYLPNNRTMLTEALTRDGKWNQSFTMDLCSLDHDELLIQLYSREKKKGDTFLGQIQVTVKALNLPPGAEWFYLSDKPDEGVQVPSQGVLSFMGKRDKKPVVSGELLIKLKFIHRLARAKTQHLLSTDMIQKNAPSKASTLNSLHTSPPFSNNIPSSTLKALHPSDYSMQLGSLPSSTVSSAVSSAVTSPISLPPSLTTSPTVATPSNSSASIPALSMTSNTTTASTTTNSSATSTSGPMYGSSLLYNPTTTAYGPTASTSYSSNSRNASPIFPYGYTPVRKSSMPPTLGVPVPPSTTPAPATAPAAYSNVSHTHAAPSVASTTPAPAPNATPPHMQPPLQQAQQPQAQQNNKVSVPQQQDPKTTSSKRAEFDVSDKRPPVAGLPFNPAMVPAHGVTWSGARLQAMAQGDNSGKHMNQEAIIIDEALKFKQQIVKKKLEQGREHVRTMTAQIQQLESAKDPAASEEKAKLLELQKSITEMEKMEKSLQLDVFRNAKNIPAEPKASLHSVPEHKESGHSVPMTTNPALAKASAETRALMHKSSVPMTTNPALMKAAGAGSPRTTRRLINNSTGQLERKAEQDNGNAPAGSSSPQTTRRWAKDSAGRVIMLEKRASEENMSEEMRNLKTKVKLLEMELERERTVSGVSNSKLSLLEKEVTRLNHEIDRTNFEKEKFDKEEKWREKVLELLEESQKLKNTDFTQQWRDRVQELLEHVYTTTTKNSTEWQQHVIQLLEQAVTTKQQPTTQPTTTTTTTTTTEDVEWKTQVLELLHELKHTQTTTIPTIQQPTTTTTIPTQEPQQQQPQQPTDTTNNVQLDRIIQMLELQQKQTTQLAEKIYKAEQTTQQNDQWKTDVLNTLAELKQQIIIQHTTQPQPQLVQQPQPQQTQQQQPTIKQEEEVEESEEVEEESLEVEEELVSNPVIEEEQKRFELRTNMANLRLKELHSNIESSMLYQKRIQAEIAEKRVRMKEKQFQRVHAKQRTLDNRLLVIKKREDEEEEADYLSEEEYYDDEMLDEDDFVEISADDDEEEKDDSEESVDPEPQTPTRLRVRKLRKRTSMSGPSTPVAHESQQLDVLVEKLEKLDKLDELLRKLDNIKLVSASSEPTDTRSYADLKVELEQLQVIILDETGKHSPKEKEDANIKYEKAMQSLVMTDEYKREIAAIADERRKKNEPLNKVALEKMIQMYNSENIKNDENLKERIQQHPELLLIGADPKAILAKHTSDFTQFLLRNLELDELRAIRASLPVFRNDQKKQIEWVDGLERKIEQSASKPPPPPKKNVTPIKFKPKVGGPAGGNAMFQELLAKRKKLDAEDASE